MRQKPCFYEQDFESARPASLSNSETYPLKTDLQNRLGRTIAEPPIHTDRQEFKDFISVHQCSSVVERSPNPSEATALVAAMLL
jgi:hypothetical protein